MADPFDVAATGDPVGSPDFYRNLLTFSAALAANANARTPQGFLQYGPGFAGPMGAAVLDAQQAARQNAVTRSNIGLQGAETGLYGAQGAGLRLKNAIDAALFNRQQHFLNLPEFDPATGKMRPSSGGLPPTAPQLPNIAAAATGTQPTAQAAAGPSPDIGTHIAAVETGGGDPNHINYGAINPQGYIGAHQFGAAALAAAGAYKPAPGENLNANEWQGTIDVGAPFKPMTKDEFLRSKAAQDRAWEMQQDYLHQRAVATGLDKHLGEVINGVPLTWDRLTALQHFGGTDGARQYVESGGRINPQDANHKTLSQYVDDVVPPQSQGGGQGQAAPPQSQVAPSPLDNLDEYTLAQLYQQGQIPQPTPAQATKIANVYRMLGYDDAAKQMLEYSIKGLGAGSEAQAQYPWHAAEAWNTAEAQLHKSLLEPREVLAEGGVIYPDPSGVPGKGIFLRNQRVVEITDPNTGEVHYGGYAPGIETLPIGGGLPLGGGPGAPGVAPPPGAGSPAPAGGSALPSGGTTSGGAMGPLKEMAPGVRDQIKSLSDEFAGKDRDRYNAATQTLGNITNMRASAAGINDAASFTQTGPLGDFLMDTFRTLNSVAHQVAGISLVDPATIRDWEDLKKQSLTMGMSALTADYGAGREAAQTIEKSIDRIPGAHNSPLGFKLVLDSLEEQSKRVVAMRNWEINWFNDHRGNLVGALEAFNDKYPATAFQNRAISQSLILNRATFPDIAKKVGLYANFPEAAKKKFLPGTWIMTPAGPLQVPGDPDLVHVTGAPNG